jgi:hypothetical protein
MPEDMTDGCHDWEFLDIELTDTLRPDLPGDWQGAGGASPLR